MCFYEGLFNLRRHGPANTLVAPEEYLGRAKAQEHVETHRDVVHIVGDIEANKLVTLTVLALVEREDQTAELLFRALDLERVLTPVGEP